MAPIAPFFNFPLRPRDETHCFARGELKYNLIYLNISLALLLTIFLTSKRKKGKIFRNLPET